MKDMLKVNEVKIEIKPFEESMKEAIEAFKKISKREEVICEEKIVFNDLDTLRSVLTKERMRLLHYIRTKHPESIYELAKMTDRKWRAVANDIEILSNVGLVKLVRKEKPKEIIKPIVNFSKMNISISV